MVKAVFPHFDFLRGLVFLDSAVGKVGCVFPRAVYLRFCGKDVHLHGSDGVLHADVVFKNTLVSVSQKDAGISKFLDGSCFLKLPLDALLVFARNVKSGNITASFGTCGVGSGSGVLFESISSQEKMFLPFEVSGNDSFVRFQKREHKNVPCNYDVLRSVVRVFKFVSGAGGDCLVYGREGKLVLLSENCNFITAGAVKEAIFKETDLGIVPYETARHFVKAVSLFSAASSHAFGCACGGENGYSGCLLVKEKAGCLECCLTLPLVSPERVCPDDSERPRLFTKKRAEAFVNALRNYQPLSVVTVSRQVLKKVARYGESFQKRGFCGPFFLSIQFGKSKSVSIANRSVFAVQRIDRKSGGFLEVKSAPRGKSCFETVCMSDVLHRVLSFSSSSRVEIRVGRAGWCVRERTSLKNEELFWFVKSPALTGEHSGVEKS